MGVWMTVAELAAVANLLLLGVLAWIWIGNYRRHGASHTLAYLVFAGFLFAENVLWLYLYGFNEGFAGWYSVTTPLIQTSMAMLCGLETIALLSIARITWR